MLCAKMCMCKDRNPSSSKCLRHFLCLARPLEVHHPQKQPCKITETSTAYFEVVDVTSSHCARAPAARCPQENIHTLRKVRRTARCAASAGQAGCCAWAGLAGSLPRHACRCPTGGPALRQGTAALNLDGWQLSTTVASQGVWRGARLQAQKGAMRLLVCRWCLCGKACLTTLNVLACTCGSSGACSLRSVV